MTDLLPHESLDGETLFDLFNAIMEADANTGGTELNRKLITSKSFLGELEKDDLEARFPVLQDVTLAKFIAATYPLLIEMGFAEEPKAKHILATDAAREVYTQYKSDQIDAAREGFRTALQRLRFATLDTTTPEAFAAAVRAEEPDANADQINAAYAILSHYGLTAGEISAPDDESRNVEAVSDTVESATDATVPIPDVVLQEVDAADEDEQPDDEPYSAKTQPSQPQVTASTVDESDEPTTATDDVTGNDDETPVDTPETRVVSVQSESEMDATVEDEPVAPQISTESPEAEPAVDASTTNEPPVTAEAAEDQPPRPPMPGMDVEEPGSHLKGVFGSMLGRRSKNDDSEPASSPPSSPEPERSTGTDAPSPVADEEKPLDMSINPLSGLRRSAGRRAASGSPPSTSSGGGDDTGKSQSQSPPSTGRYDQFRTRKEDEPALPSANPMNRLERARQQREDAANGPADKTSDDLPHFNRLEQQQRQKQGKGGPRYDGPDLPLPGQARQSSGKARGGDDLPVGGSPLDAFRRRGAKGQSSDSGVARSSGQLSSESDNTEVILTTQDDGGRSVEVIRVGGSRIEMHVEGEMVFSTTQEQVTDWQQQHGGTFIEVVIALRDVFKNSGSGRQSDDSETSDT